MDQMNTFWLECRRRFKVLERISRALKHLEPNLRKPVRDLASSASEQPASKHRATGMYVPTRAGPSSFTFRMRPLPVRSTALKRLQPVSKTPYSKRARIFSCDILPPIRRGRPAVNPCLICGYAIKKGDKYQMKFDCCKQKHAHSGCVTAAISDPSRSLNCQNIQHYLMKDRNTVDCDASPWRAKRVDPTEGLSCDLCGDDLTIFESDSTDSIFKKKNHYVTTCRVVPGSSANLDPEKSTKDSVKRMAELGVIKRLGKVDTRRDRPPEDQSSRSMSMTRNHYVSIQEEPPD